MSIKDKSRITIGSFRTREAMSGTGFVLNAADSDDWGVTVATVTTIVDGDKLVPLG